MKEHEINEGKHYFPSCLESRKYSRPQGSEQVISKLNQSKLKTKKTKIEYRQRVVTVLYELGMSPEAIAYGLGWGVSTINQDLKVIGKTRVLKKLPDEEDAFPLILSVFAKLFLISKETNIDKRVQLKKAFIRKHVSSETSVVKDGYGTCFSMLWKGLCHQTEIERLQNALQGALKAIAVMIKNKGIDKDSPIKFPREIWGDHARKTIDNDSSDYCFYRWNSGDFILSVFCDTQLMDICMQSVDADDLAGKLIEILTKKALLD